MDFQVVLDILVLAVVLVLVDVQDLVEQVAFLAVQE